MVMGHGWHPIPRIHLPAGPSTNLPTRLDSRRCSLRRSQTRFCPRPVTTTKLPRSPATAVVRRASACDLLKRALLLPWGKQAHAETQVPALALTADKRCAVHADASGGQWRGSVAIIRCNVGMLPRADLVGYILFTKQLRGGRWWSGLVSSYSRGSGRACWRPCAM